ncbi:MAG: NADH-quinone oxidoreductase subunit M [Cocleimonas sp.]|nr:NADH-quinone oxidoreductase subunit M [Cocleimonas sp.]
MESTNHYSLVVLLLLPLLGSAIILFFPSHKISLIRNTAIFFSSLCLLYVVYLVTGDHLNIKPDVLWQQQISLFENERLGTSVALGFDTLSYPMVMLTTLLVWVAVLASSGIKQQPKFYYFLILLLETAIIGVFIARDWALFYIFWEATLIPLFFLIDRWGGKERQTASLNFFLYTMGGSVFMLLSLLVLFDATSATSHSFSFAVIADAAQNLSTSEQTFVFLGFLIGFGVKMPIFPLHGWLPLAHVEAPSPISILLSGILLKMGAYGLILATVMLPKAAHNLQDLLVALALIAIVYGGLLAWRQNDMKKMIAYSSVAHMGVVLLGISTLNINGYIGAVYQMIAHGLVAGTTFMLIGLLYERTHTRNINNYGSLIKTTPKFAFFIIVAFIASVGLPGTASFVAELHVLVGGFQRYQWIIAFLSFGVLISAAYGVRTIKLLFTGPIKNKMASIPDLRPLEIFAASILTFGILLFGFFPSLILDVISPMMQIFVQIIEKKGL